MPPRRTFHTTWPVAASSKGADPAIHRPSRGRRLARTARCRRRSRTSKADDPSWHRGRTRGRHWFDAPRNTRPSATAESFRCTTTSFPSSTTVSAGLQVKRSIVPSQSLTLTTPFTIAGPPSEPPDAVQTRQAGRDRTLRWWGRRRGPPVLSHRPPRLRRSPRARHCATSTPHLRRQSHTDIHRSTRRRACRQSRPEWPALYLGRKRPCRLQTSRRSSG